MKRLQFTVFLLVCLYGTFSAEGAVAHTQYCLDVKLAKFFEQIQELYIAFFIELYFGSLYTREMDVHRRKGE